MTDLVTEPLGPILDTHHHLWKVARGDYSWMSPDMTVLYRDYLPDDLASLLRQAGVTRTILVQAADTEAETTSCWDSRKPPPGSAVSAAG